MEENVKSFKLKDVPYTVVREIPSSPAKNIPFEYKKLYHQNLVKETVDPKICNVKLSREQNKYLNWT